MITAFVRQEAAKHQGGGRKRPAVVVRSFLRFLVFRGEIRAGLEAAALTPPQWHALLSCCLTGSRAVAGDMQAAPPATCATAPCSYSSPDLACVPMKLSPYAWTISIGPTVGWGFVRGRPIARGVYPCHRTWAVPSLPTCSTGGLRVSTAGLPPMPSAISAVDPSCALVDGAARVPARWHGHPPRAQGHLFRHTAASHMLNHGASFKEVADVLGHRSLQTTGIYAKLELDALAAVALPWLGGAPCTRIS